MANTLAQKLRIKAGMTLLTLHAPDNFADQLQPFPPDVGVSASATEFDQLHWFVTDRAQLEKELSDVIKLVTGSVVCWIYYPKGTSKIQTDLTRDKGWDKLLRHQEMQWISLISFNATWSAFGFRQKSNTDKRKEETHQTREIFNYIDTTTKTIRLPNDLQKALDENKHATAFFEKLSFTNRKEYVEWIVTAKRDNTRLARVNGTIERLEKGWKNPRNI